MNHRLLLIAGLMGAVGPAAPALAHGAHITYRPATAIEIEAVYDSGEPMQAAQVQVYSPENPSEPWLQGTTDDQGKFVFTPDPALVGNWEVMVRQAGHGDVATIPVGGGDEAEAAETEVATAAAPTELSPVQKGITMGSVIWGFVGTALFFSRGKR